MIANEELQFRPGVTELFVLVPIINDNTSEDMETFSAVLTTTAAGVTLDPSKTSIHILDDGNNKQSFTLLYDGVESSQRDCDEVEQQFDWVKIRDDPLKSSSLIHVALYLYFFTRCSHWF